MIVRILFKKFFVIVMVNILYIFDINIIYYINMIKYKYFDFKMKGFINKLFCFYDMNEFIRVIF